MSDDFMYYVKIVVAIVVGWKLGVLERKVEDIISELRALQRKKAHRIR